MAFTSPALAQQRVRLPIFLEGTTYNLDARIDKPKGAGPFPLVLIQHGTSGDKTKLRSARPGFLRGAKWFVDRGYMVVTALRPGFGTSDGEYMEAAGNCRNEDFVLAGRKTAAIEAAIIRAASQLPDADPNTILLVGQSAGGFGAVALADSPPPGLKAVISFAGGRGSDGHEYICAGEDRLVNAERIFGYYNRLPQLWLYADNDHFFRPELAHRMYAAYHGASRPPVTFQPLPAFGEDGHTTFALADPSVWEGAVDAFLFTTLGRKAEPSR